MWHLTLTDNIEGITLQYDFEYWVNVSQRINQFIKYTVSSNQDVDYAIAVTYN